MLGKSRGTRAALGPRLLLLVLVLVGGACARTIAQDKATGEDGKQKGAKELRLENGEARSQGIITYPGGDRIDWKVLEIPDKKRGTLDFKLAWTPPRPGLQLAFDVFDEWGHPVGNSRKKKRRGGKTRTATIPDAKGKYFIRIYAPTRGDAGKYKLTVEFAEQVAGPLFDAAKLDIPDPPKLADLPVEIEPCDDTNFDVKKPQCKLFCPTAGAPPGWPGCKGKCPTPPDINEPACHATMPCPNPPDERVKACKPSNWPPCPDKSNPDLSNPNCRVKAKPVIGRVIRNDVSGDGLVVTVGIGSDRGVTKDWKAEVLRGSTTEPLSGASPVVVKVDRNITVVRVKLTTDQIAQNNRVRLSPP